MAEKTNRRMNLYSLKKEIEDKIQKLEERIKKLESVALTHGVNADDFNEENCGKTYKATKEIPDGVWDPSKSQRPKKWGKKTSKPVQMYEDKVIKHQSKKDGKKERE